ncbi:tRNA guanosine-2'-O-methyltransferase [Dacryopinax primogenitus]|uniref:tRNA (guanine(10)-N(2))-methyltransferase n=1 Tax=Dacryopinax primogenitus (strain DJM 731) TaxID=1858805 RepID=M5G228_DACPD|nr:tRNA guanosine-2'-O-methyltransferase [Dacryopinax primogenitus]EJU04241.1 tRNA guanosine-2'-O-methyltransferase [Dacryopinax primogenitus]
MAPYLLQFAQVHFEFRIPELESVAILYGFRLGLPEAPEERDPLRPFMIVDLDSEEHARLLAKRCILIKTVVELWVSAKSYAQLHTEMKADPSRWAKFTWTKHKYLVSSTDHTIPAARIFDVMESFDYMDLKGEINLKHPDETFVVMEEYPQKPSGGAFRYYDDENFMQVYFGRLVMNGTARNLVVEFDIKKRKYFGNTSMDAEVSLLMANQALAAPGTFIYDPFAGTGSMLYTSAYFGAYVFGSDIDGRQLRGKEKVPGILRSATQYGIANRLTDCIVFDITCNPWRCGEVFDAIITDPPYGVRAGAKRLGRKEGHALREEAKILESGVPSHESPDYRPPRRPYELAELVVDLVTLSRYMLRPGGRLVFFLPTITDDYQEVDVPQAEGMELVANSLQLFGGGVWGRRLITMEKTTSAKFPMPTFGRHAADEEQSDGQHTPGHRGFREKYFAGFRRPDHDGNGI